MKYIRRDTPQEALDAFKNTDVPKAPRHLIKPEEIVTPGVVHTTTEEPVEPDEPEAPHAKKKAPAKRK